MSTRLRSGFWMVTIATAVLGWLERLKMQPPEVNETIMRHKQHLQMCRISEGCIPMDSIKFAWLMLCGFVGTSQFEVMAQGNLLLQTNPDNHTCHESVHEAGRELTSKYGVIINAVSVSRAIHESSPYPGSLEIAYLMKTRYGPNAHDMERKASWNAENLMNSPGVQERIADKIILVCPEVSMVVFAIANSSYSSTVFRASSGRGRIGVPVNIECGIRRESIPPKLQWGYFYGGC